MKTATHYVIERQAFYRGNLECTFWTGRRWTGDLRDAKTFASRNAAENHARLNVEVRLWTVSEVN